MRSIALLAALLTVGTLGARPARADRAESSEIRMVQQVPVTAAQAVNQALQRVHGHAYDVGLEVARHGHWFEVQIATARGPRTVRVGDHHGRVLDVHPVRGEDTNHASDATQTAISLGHALQSVRKSHPGIVLEAGLEGHGKQLHYTVSVIRHGIIQAWRVDAESGAISAETHPERD